MSTRASGSIGIRQDLEVRAGHTLTPQVAPIPLESGQTLDTNGAQLICRIFANPDDSAPLLTPSFDPPSVLPPDASGTARFLITQSRTLLDAVLTAAGPEPVPAYRKRMRRLWWTCSYQDALGQLFPLYYGRFDIYLGAAGD